MVDISIRSDTERMFGLVAETEGGAVFLGIKLRQKLRLTKEEALALCDEARKKGLSVQDLTDL